MLNLFQHLYLCSIRRPRNKFGVTFLELAQYYFCAKQASNLRGIVGARRRRVAERSGVMEAKAGSRNEVSSDPGKPVTRWHGCRF